MDYDFKRRYREETIEFKLRLQQLRNAFRERPMHNILLASGVASGILIGSVSVSVPLLSSHPVASRMIMDVGSGIGGGILIGSVVTTAFEKLANSLTEWYGHEYGQFVRLAGVSIGGASVITGLLSATGMISIGSAIFVPVFFISFGFTLGGWCLYNWYKRKRSSQCLKSMQRVCDAMNFLYNAFGRVEHAVWDILSYVQIKSLRIPKRIALEIMRCSSSTRRLRIFKAYLDSLYA